MHDAQLAEVRQRRNELLEQLACLFLFQFVLRCNETEQFAIAAVLHDQEQLVRRLDRFIELDNVRVANYF